MRTIIIGDIHGCYREYKDLLKKVHYNKNKDRLILLGDLMDRGPRSYEMLQWAIRWKEENPESFFMVRGNHEQMIVEQEKDLDTRLIWRVVGKGATLRSFSKYKDHMEDYIPWITENMPLYYEAEGIRCVHAAIQQEDFEDNPMEILVKDHSESKKNLYDGKLTIIGHTPLEAPTHYDGSGESGIPLEYHEWNLLPEYGTICIDTGCVFGKRLTAMVIDEDSYYLDYVDSQKKYSGTNAHFYVKQIRRFCSLPLVRNYSSGTNSR